MIRRIESLLKGIPILSWLKQSYTRNRLLKTHSNKKLKIGYSNTVLDVKFGTNNLLTSNITLVNVEMGDYSYVNSNTEIRNARIGKFTCIGPKVTIGLGIHPVDLVSIHPAFYTNKKDYYFADRSYFDEFSTVIIGSDVWIGNGATILDGVSIGHGAIIGAGAVVTKDVEPYSIMGGVPAKLIRKRFDEPKIQKLLELCWWDWPLEIVEKKASTFRNVDQFLKTEVC